MGYYNEKREQRIEYSKVYARQNRARINLYEKSKRKTSLNFTIACNLRSRTNKAFKSHNVEKLNKTFDLVGCSQWFSKKWILHQLYGDITEKNYGSEWTSDHCYPLSKTSLSDKNGMNKSTYCINIRPMYFSENISKGDTFDHRLYLMQEIKAYQFIKLNEEGNKEDFHRWNL